ncbi:hypothetical protein D9M68_395310 [compost metagenome]
MPGDQLLQRAVGGQADELAVDHLGQVHAPPAGQRVAARHHEHEVVAAEGVAFEAVALDGVGDDADVAQAAAQGLHGVGAGALLEVDRDARMLGQEAAQHLGQVLGERRGAAHEAHVALEALAVLAELAAQPLHLLQHDARVVQQRASGLGGAHALRVTREQGRAERVFHAAHALAGRGQRHVRAAGAGREAAGFDDVEKEPQVGQVESHGGPQGSTPASACA